MISRPVAARLWLPAALCVLACAGPEDPSPSETAADINEDVSNLDDADTAETLVPEADAEPTDDTPDGGPADTPHDAHEPADVATLPDAWSDSDERADDSRSGADESRTPADVCGEGCDDGDPCTEDTCAPEIGCTSSPISCDDGDPCTVDECAAGDCMHTPLSCDDDDACTTDACDDGNCTHALITCTGGPCVTMTCNSAAGCVEVPGVDPCDDENPCTADGCAADTGCSHESTPGAPCDDASSCTTNDVCVADVCIGVTACDDANPCTEDYCLENVECVHTPQPACGGAPCGGCPSDKGFACLTDGEKHWCQNDATQEVYVPPGIVWIGCDPAQFGTCAEISMPMFKVWLPGFAIHINPVTGAEYVACAKDPAADICHTIQAAGEPDATYLDHPDYPMNYVYSSQAEQYCNWVGMRLCSEFEWEKAARGGCAALGCEDKDDACCKGASPKYTWGNAPPNCDVAWVGGSIPCWDGKPKPLDQKKAGRSIYGALDLTGNVAEFTYKMTFGDELYESALGPLAGQTVVLTDEAPVGASGAATRGSGVYVNGIGATVYDRGGDPGADATIGIRCCRWLED